MSDTLKPLSVKTEHLATKSVTSDKIADKAIENKHIKEGSVTPDKLTITPVARPMTPGLETSEIKDAAVTSAKIAPNAVTTDHIAANAVANEDIKDGAISTAKIRDGAITREKVADQSVRTEDLVDGAVTNAKIASNTITASKIAANAVGSSEIASNAVGYSEIASQSLEPRSIKTLSGLPPTPGQVPAYDESQGNLWWFKWVTPGAAARPLTPPITTDEIGDGQVTPAKLSFTPAGLTPITTVTLLNESSAGDIDQIINLDAYIPAGANFALLQLRTSAGQLMASPTVSAVIWDDYVTEPVFLANLNQGMIEGSVVTQSGPVRLYGPSAPARTIRVAHIKNGQIAITQVYLYGYA